MWYILTHIPTHNQLGKIDLTKKLIFDTPYSSVKEVTGTEEYLKKAERGGQCQNKETILECRERQFQQGVTRCGCVPFNLRNFAAKVGDLTYNMTLKGVS